MMDLEFEVENKYIGRIFGKKGENIKRLVKENSVKIDISKEIINNMRKINLYHFFSLEKIVKVKLEILLICKDIQYTLDLYNLKLNKELCSICLDDINKNKNLCITECGHKFHTSCLMKCINIKNTCPLCRAELKEFSSRKILTNEKIEELTRQTIDFGFRYSLFRPIRVYLLGLEYPGYIRDFLEGPLHHVLHKVKKFLDN